MTRRYTFRDAELRSLPLRALNVVGATLTRAGYTWPALDPDSIVAAARKQAGQIDMGEDSYREPLEQYLHAANEEADLTPFGRLGVRQMLVNSLASRARVHAWATANPQVREERIESPWVIVGLPRTGTSLLSILLGLDPASRPLLHWEAGEPILWIAAPARPLTIGVAPDVPPKPLV